MDQESWVQQNHTGRMDDDQLYVQAPLRAPQPVGGTISLYGIAARLPQLPTIREMWRAVLLGVTAGALLVQCLTWLLR